MYEKTDVTKLNSKQLLEHIKRLQRCILNIQDHMDKHGKPNDWLESEMGKHQMWLARAVKRANDLSLSLEINGK